MKKFELFGSLSKPRQIMIVFAVLCLGFGSLLNSCSNEELETNQDENLKNADNEAARLSDLTAELFRLKQKTRRFENFNVSQAQGYDTQVTEYRTQMGIHFANFSLLDDTFDLDHPEVLLYVPDENGVMQFVAVEYAVPIADLNAPPPPPEGFTGISDVWEINTEFSLWVLHVWIKLENPDGIFAARNPTLP